MSAEEASTAGATGSKDKGDDKNVQDASYEVVDDDKK